MKKFFMCLVLVLVISFGFAAEKDYLLGGGYTDKNGITWYLQKEGGEYCWMPYLCKECFSSSAIDPPSENLCELAGEEYMRLLNKKEQDDISTWEDCEENKK